MSNPVPDVDPDEIVKWFGDHYNAGLPDDDAFRLIKEFKTATPLPALSADEEVWFGKVYEVLKDGSSGWGFIFVRFKREQGQVLAFATGLQTDSGEEDAQAHALFNAVKKGAPPPDNGAAKYVKTARPARPMTALVTAGGSQVLVEDPPRWLRRSADRLLMIQALPKHTGPSGAPLKGTGRFSELWRVL